MAQKGWGTGEGLPAGLLHPGHPLDALSPLRESLPQPWGCPPKASPSQHPGGAVERGQPGTALQPAHGRDRSANTGPVLGGEGNGNQEAAAHGDGGTGFPPRLPVRGPVEPPPAATATAARRVTAVNRPTERP